MLNKAEPKIERITKNDDFSHYINVLNRAFITVANDFGLSKENCPTNNAFIDEQTLKKQLAENMEFYHLVLNKQTIGFIAIEKSIRQKDTYYIEKIAILPEYRHQSYGQKLMHFATERIKDLKGKKISIGLIDSHVKLKKWYAEQGFTETGKKEFKHLPFTVCFMEKKL